MNVWSPREPRVLDLHGAAAAGGGLPAASALALLDAFGPAAEEVTRNDP